jgi:hypothetical protein
VIPILLPKLMVAMVGSLVLVVTVVLAKPVSTGVLELPR